MNNTWKFGGIGIIGLIVIALGGFLVLNGRSSSQYAAAGGRVDSKEITFGALAPLSGQAATLGEHIRNGMELARKDAIQKYGLDSFQILYEDACDGKSSASAAQKLISRSPEKRSPKATADFSRRSGIFRLDRYRSLQ